MKRNVYLTILTIVTVICIIVGSLFHLVGFGLDLAGNLAGNLAELTDLAWDLSDDSEDASGGSSGSSDGSGSASGSTDGSGVAGPSSSNGTTATTLEPTNLDAFSEIRIDTAVMDVTVRPGDAYQISWQCTRRVVPSYRVENSVLTLSQSGKDLWRGSNNTCSVEITLPADVLLTMITASINVGDVNLENLQTQGLDLTSNVGDTDLENCSLGDVTIRANVGDVYLDNVSFTDLDITADVGDISVDSTQDLSAHSMVLNAGAGEVSVNNEDYRHSYAQTGSGGYAITLKSNVGDVELYY